MEEVERKKSELAKKKKKKKDLVGRCECAVSTEQHDQLSLCVLTLGWEAGRGSLCV